jgi:hypothetical protein
MSTNILPRRGRTTTPANLAVILVNALGGA